MSDNVLVSMIVKFVNGKEERYEFPRQIPEGNEHVLIKRINEALEAKHLIIDLESKVQIIPVHNILSIEISPPPAKLPQNCFRGAKLV